MQGDAIASLVEARRIVRFDMHYGLSVDGQTAVQHAVVDGEQGQLVEDGSGRRGGRGLTRLDPACREHAYVDLHPRQTHDISAPPFVASGNDTAHI
jgi:hypothetical protein